MKSINALVSEAAKEAGYVTLRIDEHGMAHGTYSDQASIAFKAGATFATNLTFERVVEALSNTENHNNEFYVADWLLANRSIILGTTKTSGGE